MTWPKFLGWGIGPKGGKPGATLICMRLADMAVVHPAQDNSRVCSKCGERVGIYPSGQKAIKANPGIEIVCSRCAFADPKAFKAEHRLAGPIAEIRQEAKESVPKP